MRLTGKNDIPLEEGNLKHMRIQIHKQINIHDSDKKLYIFITIKSKRKAKKKTAMFT